MHFLGVPTTRAGSCVISDSTVIRDIFYDGNPKLEKCAVVLRIAPTFIRFFIDNVKYIKKLSENIYCL